MTADSLLAELRAAGLKVSALDGWQTRGGSWASGAPVGIMQHHTAPPVPFPPASLIANSQIKANMNTKPDGTIWLIAYEATNYSSGMGSSVVLEETQRGIAPEANAKDRGLSDNTNGNPWYWNFENDHAGDGSPLPEIQEEALLEATAVVMDHWELSANQVISHAEWTARKSDPYWNNDRRAIEAIREGVDMPTADQIRDIVREELDRRLDGKLGPANGFYGIGGAAVTAYIGKTGRTLGQMVQNTDTQVVKINKKLEEEFPAS